MENKLIWKSEKEQLKEFEEVKKTRDRKYGRDGKIVSAEGKFVYREIFYLIKVLRYYNFVDGFTNMGRDRISDSHAVVEYPDETKPIINLIPYEFESEFLYHDTLHSWNDKQTTEEQIEECHKWAKEDIDKLLDGEISKRIDEGIKRLKEIKKKLNNGVKKINGI